MRIQRCRGQRYFRGDAFDQAAVRIVDLDLDGKGTRGLAGNMTDITDLAGVALADALTSYTGAAATLKRPNDLMLDGKKASGILLESAAQPDGGLAWLVVGVGVNVANSPADLADVTSLHEAGADISVETLLGAFLARWFAHIETWREAGFAPIRKRWLSFAPPEGTDMGVRLPRGDVFGRFSGIDERGSLLIETSGGPQRIDMGDVFPLPPATEGNG